MLKLHDGDTGQSTTEALICLDCARIDDAHRKIVEKEIRDTLKHVAAAVKDFGAMCKQLRLIRDALQSDENTMSFPKASLQESLEFISWLLDDHFTFLGYEKYCVNRSGRSPSIELQKDSLLGVSRFKTDIKPKVKLSDLSMGAADLILKKKICNFAKSATRSKVHRPAYCDYVLLKEFDEHGEVAVRIRRRRHVA